MQGQSELFLRKVEQIVRKEYKSSSKPCAIVIMFFIFTESISTRTLKVVLNPLAAENIKWKWALLNSGKSTDNKSVLRP